MGKTFGILGLIFGLLGIILMWFFGIWTIILPILAIVFGAIGISKDDSKALGIVGLILGIIGLVIWVLLIVLLAAFFAALLGGLT